MKVMYETPKIQFVELAVEDVIATSTGGLTPVNQWTESGDSSSTGKWSDLFG